MPVPGDAHVRVYRQIAGDDDESSTTPLIHAIGH